MDFFAECLVHVKGELAGQAFILDPWQCVIVRAIFGWKRTADGTRRYRTVYIEVPKKNGKSTLGAGLALYLLCADGEAGSEVYSAAVDREQASIVFDVAKQMRAQSPELRRRTRTFRTSIVYDATASSYKVLSADVEAKHGFNIHGLIFDELHAQPNRKLWDTLITGTASRRQPLTIAITTAGWDRTSICWEQHDYAARVLRGELEDPSCLAVIYAADEADDWADERVWAKANPNLGVSVKLDYLRAEARKAAASPAYLNTFKRLHLNLWTVQAERAIAPEIWDACAGPADLAALAGRRCYGGLDLASTSDLAALVLLFPDDHGFIAVPRFWIPEDNIAKPAIRRDPRIREAIAGWVEQGFIATTPGNVIDYDVIRRDINALGELVDLAELAIDRWNATQISTQLGDDGFTVIPFGQGFASMAAATKELLEQILPAKRLAHGGHPVLRWMAGNLAVKQDAAGNLKPDKQASSEKIDGMVALIMALDRASRHQEGEGDAQLYVCRPAGTPTEPEAARDEPATATQETVEARPAADREREEAAKVWTNPAAWSNL